MNRLSLSLSAVNLTFFALETRQDDHHLFVTSLCQLKSHIPGVGVFFLAGSVEGCGSSCVPYSFFDWVTVPFFPL